LHPSSVIRRGKLKKKSRQKNKGSRKDKRKGIQLPENNHTPFMGMFQNNPEDVTEQFWECY